MPGFHSQPSSYAATNNRQTQKRCFRDSPFETFGLQLVNTIGDECNQVNDDKVDEKDLKKSLIHNCNLFYFEIVQDGANLLNLIEFLNDSV